METAMSTYVRLPVTGDFKIPDERLYQSPTFVEEVLATGVKIVREKEAVDANAVLDGRSKVLLDRYKKEEVRLKEQHERREKELLLTCEDQQKVIELKTLEVKRLHQELTDANATGFEAGQQLGRKETEQLLAREKVALEEAKVDIKLKTTEIKELRGKYYDDMERLRKEKDEEVERVRQDKDNEISHPREHNGVLKCMDDKMGSLLGKGSTNTLIGRIGENFAEGLLKETFNSCRVTVTSDEAHRADLLFEYSGVSVRVEVKNKQKLDAADLKKFHEDIKIHKEAGYHHPAALLVQLQDTALIDGQRPVYFETRFGMPVVYCGDALRSPILFISVVKLLLRMARNAAFSQSLDETSSEEEDVRQMYQEALVEHYKTAFEYMMGLYNTEKEIREDKKLCDDRMARLREREARLKDTAEHCLHLYKLFPTLRDELKTATEATVGARTTELDINQLRLQVVKWMCDEPNPEKVTSAQICSHFKITSTSKLGKMEHLKELVLKELQRRAAEKKGVA